MWANGKQEGLGVYQNSNGVVKYGFWQNGKRLKWISEEEYQSYESQQQ